MAQDNTADKDPSLQALHSGFAALLSFVVAASADKALSFHDFEQGLWARLLDLGRASLQDFLDRVGTGDLGPTMTFDCREIHRLEELHSRDFTCIFGTFTLHRTCYGSREGQKIDFIPLDNRLQLPAGKFSYLLQDFNALLETEQPFEQVAATLERILGLKQHVDSLERQNRHMAGYVESFRHAQPVPPSQEEGAILVQTSDAKGVPMRCPADAPSIKSHDHKRGPKTGRKKQAIVGCVYSVNPLVRTPEQIVEMLFRDPKEPKPQRHKRPEVCHKRVMARLNEYSDSQGKEHDGLAEVFAWQAEELKNRNPTGDKTTVNIFDGDERFPKAKAKHEAAGTEVDIVDLLHVTPKVWDAAAQFAARNSSAAQQLVRAWTLRVLCGQSEAVLAEIRKKGEEAGLSANKKKELEKACKFMEKRLGQMRYDEYLKAGYPIASGVIEGACRHYVKDRMERTGMSWKQPGAQAMLELRSQALNGDWDEFQSFYQQSECNALYPHRHLLEELAWPLAP